MAKLTAIAQRVRRRMVDLDIGSIKELETRANLPRDTIRHLIAGRTKTIRSSKIPQLAAALQMTIDELLHGAPDGVPVSAGVSQQGGDCDIGGVRFDARVMTSFGIASGIPAWVVAEADNMAPAISAGDAVLVDTAARKITSDGIYLIDNGPTRAFRRAQINATGKQVTLGNDNPRYTAESGIAINEVVTLGRVVGVFKRV